MRAFAILSLLAVALGSHQCPLGQCLRDVDCGQESLPCCHGTCVAATRLDTGAVCWPEDTNYNLGNRSVCGAFHGGKCRLGTQCLDLDGDGTYNCAFKTRDNCACTTNAQCDSGICDSTGASPTNKCVPGYLSNGWDCVLDDQCRSGRCASGKCAPSPIGGPCLYDVKNECPPGAVCIGSYPDKSCQIPDVLALGDQCDAYNQNQTCPVGAACNNLVFNQGTCVAKSSLALGARCAYNIVCASGFCNSTGFCIPRFNQPSGTTCNGNDELCASGFCNSTAGKCLDILGVQCGATFEEGCGSKAKCDCSTFKCVAMEPAPPRDDSENGGGSIEISSGIVAAMGSCSAAYLNVVALPKVGNGGPGLLSLSASEQPLAAEWICCMVCGQNLPYFQLIGAINPDGTPDVTDIPLSVRCSDKTLSYLPCGQQIGGSVNCAGYSPAPAPVDYCSAVFTDCGAHGSCSGAGICTCRDGYTGPLCQNAPGIPPCAGVSCFNGGTCNNGRCNCVGGFGGATCAIPPTTASSAATLAASLLTVFVAFAASLM